MGKTEQAYVPTRSEVMRREKRMAKQVAWNAADAPENGAQASVERHMGARASFVHDVATDTYIRAWHEASFDAQLPSHIKQWCADRGMGGVKVEQDVDSNTVHVHIPGAAWRASELSMAGSAPSVHVQQPTANQRREAMIAQRAATRGAGWNETMQQLRRTLGDAAVDETLGAGRFAASARAQTGDRVVPKTPDRPNPVLDTKIAAMLRDTALWRCTGGANTDRVRRIDPAELGVSFDDMKASAKRAMAGMGVRGNKLAVHPTAEGQAKLAISAATFETLQAATKAHGR